MEFCKQFNDRTKDPGMAGLTIPVVITVFADRTFSFITKTPPAPVLLKKAAGIDKGSGTPNKDKKGKVTEKQIMDIAAQKMPDLNATTVEAAARSIRGTARSIGVSKSSRNRLGKRTRRMRDNLASSLLCLRPYAVTGTCAARKTSA